jgi:hypothetical protein
MKYLVLTLSLSLLCLSQVNAQVEYKLQRESTDTKFLYGNLGLVNLNVSGSRMSLAGGPGIKFYANGLYLTADYEYHYLDNLADALKGSSQTAYSIYKKQNSRNAQASAAYFLRKTKEKNVKVVVKTQGKTTYYTNVKAHVNQFFGLEVGYKSGFSNITISESATTKDDYNGLPSPNGITTVMAYNCLSFGPSFGKIEDVIADVAGYGVKKSQFFSRVYVNVLYAPKMEFEDVYLKIEDNNSASAYYNTTFMYRYSLNGNLDVSRLGFNVGYETYKFNRFGASTTIELGLLPGVKKQVSSNIYFALKIGLSFGQVLNK